MFDFLSQKFSSIFSKLNSSSKLDKKTIEDVLLQVKDGLLEADVPFDLVEQFSDSVRKDVEGQKLIDSLKPSEQLLKVVFEKAKQFLGGQEQSFLLKNTDKVLVMGLQGSGKTTTIAKLAHAQKKSLKILLASVDFYRPAAVDQLEVLAQKIGVGFYRASSANPVIAVSEIQAHAKHKGYDVLFLDTAGRLHVDDIMLAELKEIKSILQPTHKILVLDAMTGQESLAVARSFEKEVGFDGAVLSKMDSDTRGGAVFSFRYALKKPILFVGIGEKVEDLDRFYPERAASLMLGMGDLQSLSERADIKIKKSEQEKAYKSLESGSFTFHDFAQQMDMMSKIGSLGSVMKYIPGLSGQVSQSQLEQGEREMVRFRAIISSMTPKERIQPRLLNKTRVSRIARGSGVSINNVHTLIQRFEQMQQYAKLMKRSGGFKSLFRGL